MSRREFNQCLAFLHINPPEEGDNLRTASLMAQIGNYAGKSLKDGVSLSADDFLGKPKEVKQQTMEEQKAILMSLRGQG